MEEGSVSRKIFEPRITKRYGQERGARSLGAFFCREKGK